MIQVKIEKAELDDLSQFAEMEQEAGTSEFVIPYSLNEHQIQFSEPNVVYLRITDHDVIVGFFILALEADDCSVEFRRIVVSDKGKGIGQAAIRQMEVYCRDELQRSRIWLDVFEHNQRGRHIYEKLGYKLNEKREFMGKALLLYEKRLNL